MKKILKKIFQKIYSMMINRNVKIDWASAVNPYCLLKIKKNKNIVIWNSLIGKDVELSDGVKFFNGIVCDSKVSVGRYTTINGPNTRVIGIINGVDIGSFCSIAPGVTIQEINHKYKRATSYFINSHIIKKEGILESDSKGKISIGDDVWIGANAIILSGIKIGRGSIVGAGSVVTKDIPSYSIVGGNPAKVIKKRFSDETIKMLEETKWWTWDIEKIKANGEFFFAELI